MLEFLIVTVILAVGAAWGLSVVLQCCTKRPTVVCGCKAERVQKEKSYRIGQLLTLMQDLRKAQTFAEKGQECNFSDILKRCANLLELTHKQITCEFPELSEQQNFLLQKKILVWLEEQTNEALARV